jgi:hypothetical protein
MAAREVIHFSFVVQLTSRSLFPALLSLEPVSESPHSFPIVFVGPGRTSDCLAIRVCEHFDQRSDRGVRATRNGGDSNAKGSSVRSNSVSESGR